MFEGEVEAGQITMVKLQFVNQLLIDNCGKWDSCHVKSVSQTQSSCSAVTTVLKFFQLNSEIKAGSEH